MIYLSASTKNIISAFKRFFLIDLMQKGSGVFLLFDFWELNYQFYLIISFI